MQPTLLTFKSAAPHVDGIMQPSASGMLLDGYPLEELQLVKSGSWVTYKARHPYLGNIALKTLQVGNSIDELQIKKLQAEAERLRTLECPCVLPLLDVQMEPRRLSLISKYMPNGSLQSLLYETMVNEKMEWSTSFRILYEISHGLHFLHNLSPPLPHGNLKPSNVLFDEKFHVKLAVSHSHNRGYTSQLSSMTYCPPEAFSLGSVTAPPQDIYRFSVISWEVLSQKKPYKDTMDVVSMMEVVAGQRPDLSEEGLPATTPYRERVSQLMRRGWDTLPENRPDIQECVAELSCMYSIIQDDAIKQVHREVGAEELQEKLIPLDLSNSPRTSCSIQGQPCPTQAYEGLENAKEPGNIFHSITSNILQQSTINDREQVPSFLNIAGTSESKICNIPSQASAMPTPLHNMKKYQDIEEERVVPDEVQKVFRAPPQLASNIPAPPQLASNIPEPPISIAGAAKTPRLLLPVNMTSVTSDTKRAVTNSSPRPTLANTFQAAHCENHRNHVLQNVATQAAGYSGMALTERAEALNCSDKPNRNLPLVSDLALSSRNDEQFSLHCGEPSKGKAHLNDTSSNIDVKTTTTIRQQQNTSIIEQSMGQCLHCKGIHAVDSAASCWLQLWRESLVQTTTLATLNKALDRMQANGLLEIETYENICAKQTRMARVRALLDLCQCLGDKAANVVVQVLKSNFVTPLSQKLSSSISPR
uniref:receptor-interacting serine/threonine-protein kinase 3-like isoform X2 n=1 Tax=Myxine glutinosa TaxID=7769 RepID=UPI00358DEF3E